MGKVVAKFIPEYTASGDNDKISDAISATFFLSIVVGLIGFSVLAIFGRTIVADLLLISPENQSLAANALYLACAIGFVAIVIQVFQFALQGQHRFGA